MTNSERKRLKQYADICLGSCGGCKHFSFFEFYCEKRKHKARGSDPACGFYDKAEVERTIFLEASK